MKNTYDVVVIGGATAGAYFATLMAKKGYSSLIIEKDPYEKVGSRLDVFHIDTDLFEEFGVSMPKKGDDDFLMIMEQSLSVSPYDDTPKTVDYSYLVSRLTPFIHRMHKEAAEKGVDIVYDTEFLDFTYEDGKISGVRVNCSGRETLIKSRLTADCSGIPAVGRTSLKKGYGMETFKIAPKDLFYVVLRYVKLKNPVKDKVVQTRAWNYYKSWIAPQIDPEGAIIGIGQPDSYDKAEEVYKEVEANIPLPPHDVDYIARGCTPYRRPPHSLVSDGFLCLGDSACITKPFSGEGITAAWALCRIAAEKAGEVMKDGAYPSVEKLWSVNLEYFRGQGAKFAGLLATLPGAASTSAKENAYLFKKDVIFSSRDLTDMNRDFELKISTGKIFKIVSVLLSGLLTGNYTWKNVKALISSVIVSGKLREHYEEYSVSKDEHEQWVLKADELWKKAGYEF